MSNVGVFLTFPGIAAALLFAKTAQHAAAGKASAWMGVLIIPAFIAMVCRMAYHFGFWSIPVFILDVLIASGIIMSAKRAGEFHMLFECQPVFGFIFILCASICWFV